MTTVEIREQLTELLQDLLDRDDLAITRETTAKDVEGWDSLTHVRIVVAVEQKFGIRFTTTEMTDLPNVGAMIDAIARKIG